MNRIYQGRVSKVEMPNILSASNGERNQGEVSNPNPWQPHWLSVIAHRLFAAGAAPHHELFQDA
jgi:hypothetical protein